MNSAADAISLIMWMGVPMVTSLVGVVLWYSKRDSEKDRRIDEMWKAQTDSLSKLAALAAENAVLRAQVEQLTKQVEKLDKELHETRASR